MVTSEGFTNYGHVCRVHEGAVTSTVHEGVVTSVGFTRRVTSAELTK